MVLLKNMYRYDSFFNNSPKISQIYEMQMYVDPIVKSKFIQIILNGLDHPLSFLTNVCKYTGFLLV